MSAHDNELNEVINAPVAVPKSQNEIEVTTVETTAISTAITENPVTEVSTLINDAPVTTEAIIVATPSPEDAAPAPLISDVSMGLLAFLIITFVSAYVMKENK
jgi:hypothetical protein